MLEGTQGPAIQGFGNTGGVCVTSGPYPRGDRFYDEGVRELMPHRGTETEFELTTIERLEQNGCAYCHGSELVRDLDEVVQRDVFRRLLVARLPADGSERAFRHSH